MGKIYNYDTSAFIGGPVKEVAKGHGLGTKFNGAEQRPHEKKMPKPSPQKKSKKGC